MTPSSVSNLSASLRQRLLNLSRKTGEEFNLTLTRFAIERLLYRLAQSPYTDRFVLKGAMLFHVWQGHLHRPTRDLDLLGYGNLSGAALDQLFRELCGVEVEPDGINFQPDSVRVQEIREGQEYGGERVQMIAMLGTARIPMQIDVGFGDAVTPIAYETHYPTLLDLPAPFLRTYPQETVVAEKLHALVMLGMLNSRMKDYFDLWTLAQYFPFEGGTLATAIVATFSRRNTDIPRDTPIGLSAAFATDPDKRFQWQAFLARNKLDAHKTDLLDVVAQNAVFLTPPLLAASEGEDFVATWKPKGPWST